MSVCASPQAAPPCPRVTPGKEWEGSARRLLGETNTAISRYSGNVSLMQRRELCDDASRPSPVPLVSRGESMGRGRFDTTWGKGNHIEEIHLALVPARPFFPSRSAKQSQHLFFPLIIGMTKIWEEEVIGIFVAEQQIGEYLFKTTPKR